MSILSQQTVGDVIYQVIDDLSPVHSATTGTVAISTYGDTYTCVNVYDWTLNTKDRIGGEMYSFGNALDDSYTLGTWVNMNALTWTSNNLNGFTLVGGTNLTLDYPKVGKFMNINTHTMEASKSRWASMEVAPARSNAIPPRYQGGSFGTIANDSCTIISPSIFEMDHKDGHFLNVGNRMVNREASQSRTNRKHNKLSVFMLDRPIQVFNGFDNDTFTTTGWLLANDTINKWIVGTATSYSGSSSAYISNDNSSYAYTNSTAQVSHIYRTITFPENMVSDPELRFDWKGIAESGYDFMKIYVGTEANGIPVAGTQYTVGTQVGLSEYSNQSTYTNSTVTLGSSSDLKGKTRIIVISWRNDSSLGSQPISIDNLRLSYYIGQWTPPTPKPTSLSQGFEGGTLPDGWTDTNVSGTNNPYTYQSGGNGGNPSAAYEGSFNTFGYKGSTTASVHRLETPVLDLSSYSNATVNFWHTQTFWSPDQDELRVYYKTGTTHSWTLIPGAVYTTNISTWTNRNLTLPSISSNYQVGFEATMKFGRGVCIDNVVITGTT